jgi:hypothetical protein
MNEFGVLEVITDELQCNETLDSSSEMDVSEMKEKESKTTPGCSGDTETKSGGRKKDGRTSFQSVRVVIILLLVLNRT